jgi:hypothetical protein
VNGAASRYVDSSNLADSIATMKFQLYGLYELDNLKRFESFFDDIS